MMYYQKHLLASLCSKAFLLPFTIKEIIAGITYDLQTKLVPSSFVW